MTRSAFRSKVCRGAFAEPEHHVAVILQIQTDPFQILQIHHLSQPVLFLFCLHMITNLLHFDSQEQRRKFIQCYLSVKLCGISRSTPAFCTQAISEG